MEADITVLLAALEAKLKEMYPTIPVMVKARGVGASEGKVPQCGWTEGNPIPCIVVSELSAEGIDKTAPAFGFYSVDAPVAIEYVKSGSPKSWVDDRDVRRKRQELIDTLYTGSPHTNVPNLPDTTCMVGLQPLPVYAADPSEKVVASGIVLTYTFTRDRG